MNEFEHHNHNACECTSCKEGEVLVKAFTLPGKANEIILMNHSRFASHTCQANHSLVLWSSEATLPGEDILPPAVITLHFSYFVSVCASECL